PWLFGVAVLVLAMPADAQGNLDAGKSPAQIFAGTCASCHRSPREFKRPTAGFLRSHYTTGPVEASVMANYLANVGNDPRPTQQRQAQPPATDPEQAPAVPVAPRQSQPKAAQAPTGKKGRAAAAAAAAAAGEPRSSSAIMIDAQLPDVLELPARTPAVLEPF